MYIAVNDWEKDKFIISEIHKETIDGREYYTQELNVHGRLIIVDALISDFDSNRIWHQSKCPPDLYEKYFWTMHFYPDKDDYFSLIRKMYHFFLSQKQFSEDTIVNGLDNLIQNNLNDAKGILASEIQVYVDMLCLAHYQLWYAFFDHLDNDLETARLWTKLLRHSFTKYKNDIYLKQYKFSGAFSEPEEFLVKLKDFEV